MASSEVPVLLLDIDGVLNAVSKQLQVKVWPKEAWNKAKILGDDGVEYPFAWATPVIEWLSGLHSQGRVEIRWHTTWQKDAVRVGSILGLPEFAVQPCDEFAEATENGAALAAKLMRSGLPRWWKYPAAESILTDEGRRVIWIDDDIDTELTRATRRVLRAMHPVELVCPHQGSGITLKHMQQVEARLNAWEEPRGAISGS